MNSASAQKLLLMAACHESGGLKHWRQIGGPALSYFQIEAATLYDLSENYLSYRSGRQALLDAHLPQGKSREVALQESDAYACAAARFLYAWVCAALPAAADEVAMSEYCKKYWNTELGRATAQKYLDDRNRTKPAGAG